MEGLYVICFLVLFLIGWFIGVIEPPLIKKKEKCKVHNYILSENYFISFSKPREVRLICTTCNKIKTMRESDYDALMKYQGKITK